MALGAVEVNSDRQLRLSHRRTATKPYPPDCQNTTSLNTRLSTRASSLRTGSRWRSVCDKVENFRDFLAASARTACRSCQRIPEATPKRASWRSRHAPQSIFDRAADYRPVNIASDEEAAELQSNNELDGINTACRAATLAMNQLDANSESHCDPGLGLARWHTDGQEPRP